MKYDKLTPEQLNSLLPEDTNWTVISNDGHLVGKRQSNLFVTVKCKCGDLRQKQWNRLQENRFFSCGCLIARNTVIDIEGEIWESVMGYEGIYEVSNLGRIKRINKIKNTINGSQLFFKERLLAPTRSKGYVIYCLTDVNVNRSTVRIHIIVAKTFIPNPENLPEVNHKNGIKHHNWVDNLEWGTHQHNMTHAKETGLLKRGEDAYNSVLKEKDVLEIRRKYIPHKYNKKMLANEYGVSPSAIQHIIERRIWKHI